MRPFGGGRPAQASRPWFHPRRSSTRNLPSPARPEGAGPAGRATIGRVQGDDERPRDEPSGWGQDWAPASWSDPSAPPDPAPGTGPAPSGAPAPAPGTSPGPAGPRAGLAGAPVTGISDTLELGFATLRRSPGAVFAGGAALGVTLLALELVGWWVLRGFAQRLLPDDRALHADPLRALAGIDRGGLVGALVTMAGVLAAAWVLVLGVRTVVDGVVATAAARPGRRVPAGEAFRVARRRLGPLLRGGLVVGAVSAALVALPVGATLLFLVNPPMGALAMLVALLVAVPGLAWLWVRSSLLGADLVSGPAGVRAAWRRDGQLLRQGLGTAVVLLVVGALLAVAAGGTASVPLQYVTAVMLQQAEWHPLLWVERSWWAGPQVEVVAAAGAHAVATAVGYPLLSVLAALIWTERTGSDTSTSDGASGSR